MMYPSKLRKPLSVSMIVMFTLLVLFASATPAQASTCGNTVTVQRGDFSRKSPLAAA